MENESSKESYKMYNLKRKGAPGSEIGEKQIKKNPDVKWNKGSGEFRAKSYLAKLPVCKKELNKSLELGGGSTRL